VSPLYLWHEGLVDGFFGGVTRLAGAFPREYILPPPAPRAICVREGQKLLQKTKVCQRDEGFDTAKNFFGQYKALTTPKRQENHKFLVSFLVTGEKRLK
jgi:hypothetical protein